MVVGSILVFSVISVWTGLVKGHHGYYPWWSLPFTLLFVAIGWGMRRIANFALRTLLQSN